MLTGTPLQNNLMELWSLMHFLMPDVFQSHKNFKEWFSNPLTGMVEDSQEYNESLVRRLHKVLRPFLLRRLKNEVEKQLPKKYEHVVYCNLSKRQRYLYDDFMSRAKTRETLAGGNFMSVINVLMQLRKVCNHPNLFEPRPTLSPFVSEPLPLPSVPKCLLNSFEYNPLNEVNIHNHPLCIAKHESDNLSAFSAFSLRRLQNKYSHSTKLLCDYSPPPSCPRGQLRMTIKYTRNNAVNASEYIPLSTIINNNIWIKKKADLNIRIDKGTFLLVPHQIPKSPLPFDLLTNGSCENGVTNGENGYENPNASPVGKRKRKLTEKMRESLGEPIEEISEPKIDKLEPIDKIERKPEETKKVEKIKDKRKGIFCSNLFKTQSSPMKASKHSPSKRQATFAHSISVPSTLMSDELAQRVTSVDMSVRLNKMKIMASPMFGCDLREALTIYKNPCDMNMLSQLGRNDVSMDRTVYDLGLMKQLVKLSTEEQQFLSKFHLYVPPVLSIHSDRRLETSPDLLPSMKEISHKVQDLSPLDFNLQLPEARLIQYDCGKLQVLGNLMYKLKSGGHRVLLFTQMTRMLDVLEAFLNYHGYIYLRLDGSTRVEQRQILMERFNGDTKYFCFILSTRSGGVGVNLTGADTVIFYDSDWNPTMDAQAQDRCHRIGQTRDVHIYRLVSEMTVEENILKKANQKRLLGDLAIDGGNFTTSQLKTQTIRDLFDVNVEKKTDEQKEQQTEENPDTTVSEKKALGAFESAIAAVEDKTDTEVRL